ncbi:hypothetical protein ACOMHN_023409 [Nucella lapillus]
MFTNKPLAPLQQPVSETQSLYRGEGNTCKTSSTTSKERSHLLNDKAKSGDNRPNIFPLASSPSLTDLLAEPSTQSQPVSGKNTRAVTPSGSSSSDIQSQPANHLPRFTGGGFNLHATKYAHEPPANNDENLIVAPV